MFELILLAAWILWETTWLLGPNFNKITPVMRRDSAYTLETTCENVAVVKTQHWKQFNQDSIATVLKGEGGATMTYKCWPDTVDPRN